MANSKFVGAIMSLVFQKFEKGCQVDTCARAFARFACIGMPLVGRLENLSRNTGHSEAQEENFQGFNAVGLSSRDGIAQFEAPRETDNIAGSGERHAGCAIRLLSGRDCNPTLSTTAARALRNRK